MFSSISFNQKVIFIYSIHLKIEIFLKPILIYKKLINLKFTKNYSIEKKFNQKKLDKNLEKRYF